VITELGCAFLISKGLQYLFSDEITLKNKWKQTLLKSKVDGIRNKDNQTFIISKVYKKQYGYLCTINIPKGLSVSALESATKVIEDNLNCIIEIEKERFKEYITVKLVNKVFDFKYAPVTTKSNELFLGYKLDNGQYILNLDKDPHILISGKTGTGKSFLFASILTNLIYYSSKEIEIYLFQKMKGEIDTFKNCPGVKFCSNNDEEILIILEKLVNIINKRSKQFASEGIRNINHWNNTFPNRRMKRIIIGIEEIAFFMKENLRFFDCFNDIVKTGRSAGVHIISLTQRTTATNLGGNGEFKSQLTVITAKQRSELDSRNAIDISDAAYLSEHEFIASSNDGYVHFKSPLIDEDYKALNKYVPEIIIPTFKKVVIKDNLSYEDSQKLKTYSEFHLIENNILELKEASVTTAAPALRKSKKGVKSC
jgi:hypothetical protein